MFYVKKAFRAYHVMREGVFVASYGTRYAASIRAGWHNARVVK